MPENNLPLLIFPFHRTVEPERRRGFPSDDTAKPTQEEQARRLEPQFHQVKMAIQNSTIGIAPEVAVVFVLADRIENLQSAVENAGIEFLAEWDLDFEGDEEFPSARSNGMRDGRLFVTLINEQTVSQLLNLWKTWKEQGQWRRGQTKWRDIFGCLKDVRRWGVQEILHDTKMDEYFSRFDDEQDVNFQIECFYSKDENKRRENETSIKGLINELGGRVLVGFIDKEEIGFHAVRVCMKAGQMKQMIQENADRFTLLSHPFIMYFQQAGQSIVTSNEEEGEQWLIETRQVTNPPVAAVLDGVPQLGHEALSGLIDFDDPFTLAEKYQDGERIHGTAMDSLIIHGDGSLHEPQINSRLHHVAVMQPDENARNIPKKVEHFPVDCFIEDRIERAVRRTLEGEAGIPALSPQVKIINLSLGDPQRIFNYTPSPWARLLDWLSWKYRVLFCVSVGNYDDNISYDMDFKAYQQLGDEEKKSLLLQSMKENRLMRRLIAPAESINSLTVGALHGDGAGAYYPAYRVDLLPDERFPSPISRFGHGFRQSVKPELYMPGGRQLYNEPLSRTHSAEFKPSEQISPPGLKAARDSNGIGMINKCSYTAGTSNAAALATRAGIQIQEMLGTLNSGNSQPISEELKAVIVKALLVHSSKQAEDVANRFDSSSDNVYTRKKDRARYIGYGTADVQRVLACTEQRGTVIGCDEIAVNEVHEYRFPLPDVLSGLRLPRMMMVTLAWLSPVNARRRNYREARLEIQPSEKWKDTPVKVERLDGDHNQVKRGTVQHEVLTGESRISAYATDTDVVLKIACLKDATNELLDKIPYGLAVTLEIGEESGINIYEGIRDRLRLQQPVGTGS